MYEMWEGSNKPTFNLNWKQFAENAAHLIPNRLADRMRLYFVSYVPIVNGQRDIESYAFSRHEMVQICKDSLRLLAHEFDSYFEELSVNLAKMIYKIVGLRWEDMQPITIKMLVRSFRMANNEDSKMMNLLFGTVGLLNIDEG